ncbi:hypothetical protein ABFS83_14G088500 [Erythranthe nasuta]
MAIIQVKFLQSINLLPRFIFLLLSLSLQLHFYIWIDLCRIYSYIVQQKFTRTLTTKLGGPQPTVTTSLTCSTNSELLSQRELLQKIKRVIHSHIEHEGATD